MPYNTAGEDLRSKKTKKAIYIAMFSLLKKNSFRKITVKQICEEALSSRAAFYAHFIDKYDLLRHCMAQLWPEFVRNGNSYSQIERTVNLHIIENGVILQNLVDEADNETFDVIYNFLLSTISNDAEIDDSQELYIKDVVLSNFYAGGIISYALWQINNSFPPDVPMMNRYFYEIFHELQDWQTRQGLDIGGSLL